MNDHTLVKTYQTGGTWVAVCSCGAVRFGHDRPSAEAEHVSHATARAVIASADRFWDRP